MIAVVLVDDHKILQQGVARMLESSGDFKVAAFADTAETGLFEIERNRPGLAILDLGLPDHSGLWLIRRVRKFAPELPIIVLSMHSESEVVQSTIQAGANGYLRKSTDEATLLLAARTVVTGENFVEADLEGVPSYGQSHGVSEKYLDSVFDTVLSGKELEVLRLIYQGLNNQEIASTLQVSHSTVKARLRSIFTKLNVDNRTQAVAAVISLGLDLG